MGLFRDIGRRAERLKQTATEAAREVAEPDYRCRDCEAAIDGEVDACPDCGSTDLVAVDGDDETDGAGSASGEA